MKKTLYLDSSQKYEITIDGPSLCIKKENYANIRIPLRIIESAVINANGVYDWSLISTLFFSSIPILFYKNNSQIAVYAIPYNDTGNFYKSFQRLASENKEKLEKFKFWIKNTKRKNEIEILRLLSENIGIAFNERGYTESDYIYTILNLAKTDRDRYFTVKRFIRGIIRQIIIYACINNNIDPKIGILYKNKPLGMVRDISYAVDAEADYVAINFFKLKQQTFWENNLRISKEGIKMIATLFERRKNNLKEKLKMYMKEITNIIC